MDEIDLGQLGKEHEKEQQEQWELRKKNLNATRFYRFDFICRYRAGFLFLAAFLAFSGLFEIGLLFIDFLYRMNGHVYDFYFPRAIAFLVALLPAYSLGKFLKLKDSKKLEELRDAYDERQLEDELRRRKEARGRT